MKNPIFILLLFQFSSIDSQDFDLSHFELKNTDNGMSNSWISDIIQGPQGYIWIATQNGINRFDGSEFLWYQRDLDNEKSLNSNWVRNLMFIDTKLIYSGHGKGLGIYDLTNQEFLIQNNFNILDSIGLEYTYYPVIDSLQQIWVDSPNELTRLSLKDPTKFDQISIPGAQRSLLTSGNSLWIFSNLDIREYDIETLELIHQYEFNQEVTNCLYFEGSYWITSEKKIIQWNQKTIATYPVKDFIDQIFIYKEQLYFNGPNNIYLLSKGRLNKVLSDSELPNKTDITRVYASPEGRLWIGTSKGIFVENSWKKRLRLKRDFSFKIDETPRAILSTREFLFLGDDEGLIKYDKNNQREVLFPESRFQSLAKYGDHVWGGTASHQVYKLESDHTFKEYQLSTEMGLNSIYSISAHEDYGLFACTWWNIFRYQKASDTFQQIDLSETEINVPLGVIHSTLDSKGDLWLATNGNGLIKLHFEYPDQIKPSIKQFRSGGKNSINSDIITCVYEDSKGYIWISTDAGINKVNSDGTILKSYGRNHGLVDEKIMSIEEDDSDRLWFSTIGHGIYIYYPEDESFVNITKDDGLISNNFYFKSSDASHDGQLYFGSDEGVQVIDPNQIQINSKPKKILFTRITTYSSKDRKLFERKDGINLKEPLVLNYNENDLQIAFAALDFNLSNKIHFEYSWESDPNKWVSLGSKRELILSGLSPGNYGLKIKGLIPGQQNFSTSETFKFKIKPPWWNNWIAYLLYAITAGSIANWIYRLQLRRNLALAEAKNTKELATLKNQLLAYIAHEFKTPLTLIKGSTQYILNRLSSLSTPELIKRLEVTDRQTDQLNKLVHEVLNLKENNLGVIAINPETIELIKFTKIVKSSFESWAQSKQIDLSFNSNIKEPLWVEMDKEKYFHILSNMISNALKYTPNLGFVRIDLGVEIDQIKLSIHDSGAGFDDTLASELLKPYTRVSENDANANDSHGLGLTIVNNLVSIMGGQFEIKSEIEKGSSFYFSFPLITSLPESIPNILSPIEVPSNTPGLEKILIVEDNSDISDYLKDILSDKYEILHAANGVEGSDLAKKVIPDLILSDVMMPLMNGLEMTELLKADQATSHIPIIILSAKGDVADRIKGYQIGADQYLGKPFNENELLEIIKSLFNNRKEIAQHFSSNSIIEVPKNLVDKINSSDRTFLSTLNNYISENISDPDLTVENVCSNMLLSRSQLHRKLTALTAMSLTKYINKIRIQTAQSLMLSSDLAINQIAYDVGFSDPGYFTKIFKKETGLSPTQYKGEHLKTSAKSRLN